MQLHDLAQPKQRAQRIGRGGKRGKTSGRGQKGQKSRAGHKIRPAMRDLIQRLPKLRGFANKAHTNIVHTISVSQLGKMSAGQDQVTPDVLKAAGLVPKRFQGPVKVLSNGSITTAVKLVGVQASEGARAKIEAAGGSVA